MNGTNTLTLDHIDLSRDQSITLSYSHKGGAWWAVLWRDGRRNQRAILSSEGETPLAALAELMVEIGARPDLTN